MCAVDEYKRENVNLLLEWGADAERSNKDGKAFRALSGKYGFENKKIKKFRDFAFLSLLLSATGEYHRRAKPGSDLKTLRLTFSTSMSTLRKPLDLTPDRGFGLACY